MSRLIALVAFALCAMLVGYGLFRPEPAPNLFSHSDKFFHIGAFAALYLTGVLALAAKRVRWWVVVGFLMMAPLSEAVQSLLQASRLFSIEDIVANALGVGVGVVLHFVWQILGSNKSLKN